MSSETFSSGRQSEGSLLQDARASVAVATASNKVWVSFIGKKLAGKKCQINQSPIAAVGPNEARRLYGCGAGIGGQQVFAPQHGFKQLQIVGRVENAQGQM